MSEYINCPNCGGTVESDSSLCPLCGKPLNAKAYRPEREISEEELPSRFKRIHAWGYVGYQILFSIPIIGLVLLIVFACGGTKNLNLRSYARSYFCAALVGIILLIILIILGVVTGAFEEIINELNELQGYINDLAYYM